MEIPTANFFSVTINSQKLHQFMLHISTQLNQHQLRLDQLAKNINNITLSLTHKHKNQSLELELERIKRIHQQENNYLQLYMKDADKKTTQKIAQLENTIVTLDNKIIAVRQSYKEDFTHKFASLQHKINSITTTQSLQNTLKKQIQLIRQDMAQINVCQATIAQRIDNDQRKMAQLDQNINKRFIRNEEQHLKDCETLIKISNSNNPKSLSRKKNRNEQPQEQDMSNLLERLQQTENTLLKGGEGINDRNSILSNSLIIKSKDNITNIPNQNKSRFANLQSPKQNLKQFQNAVDQKLLQIQHIAGAKLSIIEKEIQKILSKNQIVDEHVTILSCRLDKQKIKIGQITQNIKKYDDKRTDQKIIDTLRTTVKKIAKDADDGLSLRLTKQAFDKQMFKINENMNFFTQMIELKADKSDVRKGMNFMEEKIKQIILVLAEERFANHDGAIKRMPFKCLSCDKDLEPQKTESIIPLKGNKENPSSAVRCKTNEMRKRIRLVNHTMSTITANDD